MALSKEKLKFWIEHNYNVLFVGKHGVGKTSIVRDAFEKAGLHSLYYSASTMDPWVDMIGVPKERIDENGNSYLDLVRPREFQSDSVEAIFFDEFNRSHKKIRNAVMELLQYKSINGHVFHNLRVVWAAINPEDEEDTYDVDRLDPAQEDRFHIRVNMPYKPSKPYFSSKYGKTVSRAAMEWWSSLSDENKDKVSPRRLDYALDIHAKGGDLRDVLPHSSNISKLVGNLANGPVIDIMEKFVSSGDKDKAGEWLNSVNNFAAAKDFLSQPKYTDFFVPLLNNEYLSMLIKKDNKVKSFALGNYSKYKNIEEVLVEISVANQSKSLTKEIKKHMGNVGAAKAAPKGAAKIKFLGDKPLGLNSISRRQMWGDPSSFSSLLSSMRSTWKRSSTTYRKRGVINDIWYNMPQNPNITQIEQTMDILNRFARSSQASSLHSPLWDHKLFWSSLNHVLHVLYREGYTFEQILSKPKLGPFDVLEKAAKDYKVARSIATKL